MTTPASQEFRKSLNLFDATSLVAGSMIGSGIFIVSADIARNLGSPGWMLLVWLLAGVMTIIAALSYGELAAMMPRAGGQYIYLREAYSPLSGFLYGWTLFLVIQTGTIAAVAMAFAKFSGVFIPWFSEKHFLLEAGGIRFSSAQLLAILSIVLLTWINTLGIKTGKRVQNGFTSFKVITLLGFILAGLLFARNPEAISANASAFWDAAAADGSPGGSRLSGFALLAALGVSMVGTLFSSDAWNNLTFASEEVKNPGKTIARSLLLGTAIVTLIYILVNVVYIQALPLRGTAEGATVMERGIQHAASDRIGSASLSAVLGNRAALVTALIVLISTFGCNNGLILAGSRAYYAMAKDGLLFSAVGRLNAHAVPSFALWMQCIWASLLCLTGTYSQLLDYVIFAVLIFYVLTILGIFILRKKRPEWPRPYKAPGYPYLPALYVTLALMIMLSLLVYRPLFTWPGLLIVILGIPAYYLWKKFARS